ncbi:MAG: DUF120 domain-containing protein [Thermodesulfobacteriota bacterium]|nr:DUF120 domain-containing protein [Thermodesulfobacteriota bacterium]
MDKKCFKGKIVSGKKEAGFFVSLDWVVEQCKARFNFTPFFGTLNLKVEDEDIPYVVELKKRAFPGLVPPDPQFCEAKTLKAQIGDIKGILVFPEEEVNIHGNNILEVIAPVKIKDELDLKDGDGVEVIIKESF